MLEEAAHEFLVDENVAADDVTVARFLPHFVAAQADAYRDLQRAARGDYSPSAAATKFPERTTAKLDLITFFEEFVAKGGLKGGANGPTAKRWRPKIKMFTDWLGHRDLTRMTTLDGYGWVDHLTERGFATKSVRDVWIASLSATAGFATERRKVSINVFRGITVRDAAEDEAAASELPRQKGFTLPQAEIILTATLDARSHLISEETMAARRWLPWLCAYSGARVNEFTSLCPVDVAPDKETGIWCLVIKPGLEKTAQWRKVPIHRAGIP